MRIGRKTMKRTRYLAVAALAAASIGFGAAPASASACPPDDQAPCQCESANDFFKRLTGQRLLNCS